ncbi:HTH domain-containing protein [Natrinema sp. 74]|uniref:HTH domain-containing protein n=1 Tax=Natrinema sp. 74 TaxID=3384159 RepID=UPI0038D4655F
MSSSEFAASPVVDIDPHDSLRVDCYVRSAVPAAVSGTIETVVERLRHLRDTGRVADCQIERWPPAHRALAGTNDDRGSARRDLVAEFERWAAQRDVTLEPAFRRRETPSSPLGIGSDSRERVRVPLVALSLYEDEPTASGEGTLRGVVPFTEESATGETRTHTVEEWLAAAETDERSAACAVPSDQPTQPEGRR